VKARAAIGLTLLGLMAGVLVLLQRAGPMPAADGSSGQRLSGTSFAGPRTCLPCHAAVVAEWEQSMHAASFTDPQVRAPDQSDNFQKQECLPCHVSAPIFEHGIETDSRALARVERRSDGIDCLACHALPGGGVAASRGGLSGPCNPIFRPELAQHHQCYACHNQHNTHDEWLASPAAAQGQDCATCHMPRVTREGPEAGAPRAGFSHRFLGGRDRDFALAGLHLEHGFDPATRKLTVTLTNTFAGHNLPTDSRNRALDLVLTLYDARGQALPPLAPQSREPGSEAGTARQRLRNPYRSTGDPNTQLPAGSSSTIEVPQVPAEATHATAALYYKLTPFTPDEKAHWSESLEFELR
jgi:hypothetical protein